ncbi:hypothetical protein CB0940_09931 [Cercospora beticola]|uniref:Uncharacterized protein n=1 Tax=Cercospora beticola TaxID=122368 RepID=A0A2G5HHM5_CERBT|nr:hypothetical protein CB0940_09931 [Cercospora beticola]PIA92064.1 hypothetical protein CB0940_09931 [Cercospora beticola]WPB05722.1 hypothetical protein RHO25_010376 [Cercospora beticola]
MVSAKSFALLTLVGMAAAMPGPVYRIDRRVVRRDGGSQKEGGSGSDSEQYCVLYNLDTQLADDYAAGVTKQICPSFGGKADGGFGPCGDGSTVACIGGQMTKSQDFAKEFNKKAQEADPKGHFMTSCFSADGNSMCASDIGCKTFPPESSSEDQSSC